MIKHRPEVVNILMALILLSQNCYPNEFHQNSLNFTMLNTVLSLFFLATSLEVYAQNTSASTAATTAASSLAQATTKATQAPTASSASPSSPCDPWPKLNKSLTDCCIIPYHTNLNVERSCFVVACNKTNLTINSTTISLTSSCYFQATRLVVDGKADKEVAKAIYKNQSEIYTKFIGHNPWATIIDEAVTKCEIPAGVNMTENLIKFYLCTNDYLIKNCPLSAIDSSDACDPVEEHYEQCKGPKPNCDEWPMKLMLPEYCCNCPEIVLPSVMSGCYSECKSKTFQREKATCVLDCKNKKLNWKKNGKFDFEAVKSLLMANALKSDLWEKSIATVVETCRTVIEGRLQKMIFLLNSFF